MILVWSLTCYNAYDFYLGTACPLSRVSKLPLLCSGAIHPLLTQLTHCSGPAHSTQPLFAVAYLFSCLLVAHVMLISSSLDDDLEGTSTARTGHNFP